jgi:3-hydroxyisobutyrate dehydrogenase-like beta-hydroxyacid dehydrogenase
VAVRHPNIRLIKRAYGGGVLGLEMNDVKHGTTVGILYCGDMGSALGRLFRKEGLRVVTTCQGRSSTTEEQARLSGIEILPELDDVVAQSHLVFSIVLPMAAGDVAQQYADRHEMRPKNSVFVEANSNGMEKLTQIERVMSERNIPLVDAAIHGAAHRLEDIGVLYVSGPRARSVEEICRSVLRVDWLGEQIGSASRMKLIMSGMSKTLTATFLEVGVLAERTDMLEPFLENCHHFYSGIMTVIDRTLPTYPRHAARRFNEIGDIEQMAHALQLRLGMTHEAGHLIELIASIDWSQMESGSLEDIRTIIRSVAKVCQVKD